MQNRTHTCDELRLSDAGKRVQLSGWMDSVRIVSANLAFVILRDFYGTTQVVIDDEEQMKIIRSLNKESVISVTGIVRERDNKNPKIPTGDIEVEPEKIDVLGRCRYNELPFQINRSREADESIRLKYRYLDLRNPDVKKNIVMRCNVVTALRQAMNEHGFLEITTPILTASSPEGARDYLVPARKHPGMFYALPQGGDDVAAQDDVLLDGGVARVEIAVLQTLGLIRVAAAVDLEREFVVLAAAEQFDLLRHDFNVAGGLLGVLACAFPHGAGHGDGRFLVDALDDVHDLFRFNDDLRCAVEITQNEEGKVIADHADIFHPADERNMFACVFDAELAAGMGS